MKIRMLQSGEVGGGGGGGGGGEWCDCSGMAEPKKQKNRNV